MAWDGQKVTQRKEQLAASDELVSLVAWKVEAKVAHP